MHGNVQTLSVENLADGRDLAVTTDFRSIFSEVADKHLKINNDTILFPGWKEEKIGIMK